MKKRAIILPFALIAAMIVGCDNGSSNNNDNNKGTLKEKEEVKGLKLLSIEEDISAQYDWEEYAKRSQVSRYSYYNRGNSGDNNIQLFNPDDYAELQGSSTQSQVSSKKQLKKKDVSKQVYTPKKGDSSSSSGEKPQFEGVLNEEQFFALSSTLGSAVKDNTSMTIHADEDYEYVYFEIDAGYKSSTIDMTYNIYDNDVVTQNSSTTSLVATDETYENHEEQTTKNKGFINNRDIDGVNYFVQIVHELPKDGESEPELKDGEKYSIPNNYRILDKNVDKTPVKDYFNFQMRSNFTKILSKSNYEAVDSDGNLVFDKNSEWYSSSKDEAGNITLQYNQNLYYEEGTQYAGQGVVQTIYAQLDSSNRLLKYGYSFEFTYYGDLLRSYAMVFSYGYDSIGEYQETDKVIFDYNKYYDNGTLVPNVENGNKHDEAEALLEQVNDTIIAAEINEPTGVVREYNYSQKLSSKTYEEESLSDTTLYNDNVSITYLSQTGTDDSNNIYAESAVIQQFNKDGNNYQIQQFYGTSRYSNGKVTTPYSEGNEPEISLLDTSVIRNIRKIYKNSKRPNSAVTTKLTASLIPEGIDEETNVTVAEHYVITLQACIQQSVSDGKASLGYVYTYKISFRLITK